EPLDHGSFADARLAHKHGRIRTLAMAENLYHLLNLLLATDGRRQLVLSGKAIQRDAEMFQIRRQLEFLLVLLLFLFAYEYARSYVLHNSLRVRAEIPQHLDEQSSLVLREGQ